MRSRLLDELILKSWWAILALLIIFFVYDRSTFQKEKEKKQLVTKYELLKEKKAKACALQEGLEKQIASHTDPRWIELTLMRKLGLVPEGSTKVVFKPPCE